MNGHTKSGVQMATEGRFTVFIERWRPESLNKIMRMHWTREAKVKNAAKMLIADAFRKANTPPATGKRLVVLHIVLGHGMQRYDFDNSFKHILDGLKACRMLIDDSDKFCKLHDEIIYSRDRNAWGTEITLEDLA